MACPQCGCRLSSLAVNTPSKAPAPGKTEAHPQPKTFFSQLAGAFCYPLRGNGPWLLVSWAIFMLVMGLAKYFLRYAGLFGAPGFALIAAFTVGFLCAYMLKIILSSAAGEDSPPDWPRFAKWRDDLLHPFLLIAGTVMIFLLPAGAYWYANISENRAGAPLFTGSPVIVIFLSATGLFLLPMGILGVAMYDSFQGLNPLRMLRSIARVPGSYTVALGFMLLAGAAEVVLSSCLRGIPIVSTLVSGPVGLYFLIVEMRIIGLIYGAYAKRLDWFDEASDPRNKG
jgi:hypothetical protein